MAKLFILSVVALVCAGLVAAESGLDPNNALDKIWIGLIEDSPAATCTTECPQDCAEKNNVYCINVPGVMDCAAELEICLSACDETCACYKGCTTKCIEKESCEGVPHDEVISCNLRHHVCVVTCNVYCPTNGKSRELEGTLHGYANMVNMMSGLFDAMKNGGQGGQEPAPTK